MQAEALVANEKSFDRVYLSKQDCSNASINNKSQIEDGWANQDVRLQIPANISSHVESESLLRDSMHVKNSSFEDTKQFLQASMNIAALSQSQMMKQFQPNSSSLNTTLKSADKDRLAQTTKHYANKDVENSEFDQF